MKTVVYCSYCGGLWIAKGDDAAAAWPRYGSGPFQKRLWDDPVPVMVCPDHRAAIEAAKKSRVYA